MKCDSNSDHKKDFSTKGSSTYSAIHKAAGLMVPGQSMILPGTIPENFLGCEWGWILQGSHRVVPAAGRTLDGGFLNRAVTAQLL